MKNKGDIWVSAVLYLTLGVIALALILSAGIPLINKMKDRNTIIQTKEILTTFDEVIKRVANEGPGSQRELPLVTISAGKLIIDESADTIFWTLDTEAIIQEPEKSIQEGVVTMTLRESKVVGRYTMEILTAYPSIDLKLNSAFSNPFVGKYALLIRHTGSFTGNKPVIELVVS